MTRGKFIVMEGIDGCGKTTQYNNLFAHLKEEMKYGAVFGTKEPNTFDNNGLRAIEMLKSDRDPYDKGFEAMKLFALNRKAHNQIFIPLLNRGVDVLSDRYWHSNFAYQHAQGIPHEEIVLFNSGSLVPDLTILIDLPVDESVKRRALRDGNNFSKYERNADFLHQVRLNYLNLQKILPENIAIIDGTRSKKEVWDDVLNAYKSRFQAE